MMGSTLKNKFQPEIYNALSPVEIANQKINHNEQKVRFLMQSAELLAKYNLRDKLGIGLLHKHNDVKSDERMIQFQSIINGERALVTKPVKDYSENASIVPNVWKIIDGDYYPLEFTTDPLACKLYEDAQIPGEFLDEYRSQVISSPVGEFFGIAVVERDFYNTAASADDFPLEYTNDAERNNVIFLKPRTESSKAIETSWSFDRKIDFKLGCDPQSYCSTACRTECIVDENVHSKLHFDHHHVVPDHKYTGW